MSRHYFFLLLLSAALSCKLMPNTTGNTAESDPTRVYMLRLNPPPGAKYYYTVKSEQEMTFEANDKKVDNVTKTTAGVNYLVGKDTTGNFAIHIQYDKLHVYTKNGDVESDMDAANAATSADPVEKMLGTLTSIPLMASVTPAGEVKSIVGYDEIPDKILAAFPATDPSIRNVMREKLKKLVGTGIIKKNVSDIFYFFPDSAIHVGDKWKLNSTPVSDLDLKAPVSFTLVKMEDRVATIKSEGKVNSDSVSIDLGGYKVLANLHGDQQGEYAMDGHTGMLISAESSTDISGSISVMGQDVPLSLKVTVKIDGQKK